MVVVKNAITIEREDMSQCEKGIDCLQCNSRGMCSSYADFKYKQGYNKAIDDFAEKLCNEVESFTATVDGIELDFLALDYLIEFVYEVSKQLKRITEI